MTDGPSSRAVKYQTEYGLPKVDGLSGNIDAMARIPAECILSLASRVMVCAAEGTGGEIPNWVHPQSIEKRGRRRQRLRFGGAGLEATRIQVEDRVKPPKLVHESGSKSQRRQSSVVETYTNLTICSGNTSGNRSTLPSGFLFVSPAVVHGDGDHFGTSGPKSQRRSWSGQALVAPRPPPCRICLLGTPPVHPPIPPPSAPIPAAATSSPPYFIRTHVFLLSTSAFLALAIPSPHPERPFSSASSPSFPSSRSDTAHRSSVSPAS